MSHGVGKAPWPVAVALTDHEPADCVPALTSFRLALSQVATLLRDAAMLRRRLSSSARADAARQQVW